MTTFSIKDDLNGRPIDQQIEILLISGWTFADVDAVAKLLNIERTKVVVIARKVAKQSAYMASALKSYL